MTPERDIELRLQRLARATEGVGPRAGFSAQVMQRIAQEPVASLMELRLPAWRFFPVGVVMAALALFWAVSAKSQVNEALVTSDDTELTW